MIEFKLAGVRCRKFASALAACFALSLLSGCGIRETPVMDGGSPASGLPRGMRIYFASDHGPKGVARPNLKIKSLNDAMKILVAGPTRKEQKDGLKNYVPSGRMDATGEGDTVEVIVDSLKDRLERDDALGQLVCTLARAQSELERSIQTHDIKVTVRFGSEKLGPYGCSEFLRR